MCNSPTEKKLACPLKKPEHQYAAGVTEGTNCLKPPIKANPFHYYDSNHPTEKLQNAVQHTWWLSGTDNYCQVMVESELMEAQFARLYEQYIQKECNLLRYIPASTITEMHAIRELLWMFHMPQRCTMFDLDNDNHIKMRNVTIPSATIDGLRSFLATQFFPYIEMMNSIRCFRENIYSNHDVLPPKTIECYASQLNALLESIWNEILIQEAKLITPAEFSVTTLIQVRFQCNEIFQHLHSIYDLHRNVILNWREQPAHICSAFLLANLMHNYQNSNDISKAHLAISLLLGTMKVFCEIIDTWWLEGRLDDWGNEFIVERYLYSKYMLFYMII